MISEIISKIDPFPPFPKYPLNSCVSVCHVTDGAHGNFNFLNVQCASCLYFCMDNSIYTFIYLSIQLFIMNLYLFISIYPSMIYPLCIYLSIYPSIHYASIYPSIHPYIMHLSIYPTIQFNYWFIHPFICHSIQFVASAIKSRGLQIRRDGDRGGGEGVDDDIGGATSPPHLSPQ